MHPRIRPAALAAHRRGHSAGRRRVRRRGLLDAGRRRGIDQRRQSGQRCPQAARPTPAPASLKLLFGSSGPAETDALNAATKAWSAESGSTVTVTPAQDLIQQLAQGFSSGQAPDVFYVGADQFANYAKAGNLLDYADSLSNADDFYPALKDSFTYDGKFYCAPKDMSTLALFINTDMWTAAGLTDADIPKNWDDLSAVAKKLTSGNVAGSVRGTGTRPVERLPGPERVVPGQRGRKDRHRQRSQERRGAASTSSRCTPTGR